MPAYAGDLKPRKGPTVIVRGMDAAACAGAQKAYDTARFMQMFGLAGSNDLEEMHRAHYRIALEIW
ncbi:hypothetical protein GCM10007857_89070 [Bradyrhizobium iriomotense]|uniref:Uncharacterized protein n=1 Tax=Bradyrhizobium iriomotense TaxID=441950 RepID=A0ABQ6BCS3_9BRAD|nr:hypothetical protein GCM10007857_89070 [Bradyrhizobium iriomotense]